MSPTTIPATDARGRRSLAACLGMAELAPVVCLEGVDWDIGDDRTNEDDDVDARSALPVTEQLPDAPFCPVSPDRSADAPRCDYAEPGNVEPVRQREERQVTAPAPEAVPLDPLELRPPPYPLPPRQTAVHGTGPSVDAVHLTAIRLRPLARRRCSTRWPAFALIRFRNPCVRRRRRRFG